MTIASEILDRVTDDIQLLRELSVAEYVSFVHLKDGRQRFLFSDNSYIDIRPKATPEQLTLLH